MIDYSTSTVTVIIGGDVHVSGKNYSLFQQDNPYAIWGDQYNEINNQDLFIVNLEAPFIQKYTPIVKDGPIFVMDPSCIKGIVNSGIDGVNLANNHIMDSGEAGLHTTIQLLQENNIFCFGAGKNLAEAGRVYSVTVKGKRIGFLGMADREFSIAGKNKPGANPSDIIEFVQVIRNQCSELDFLIVLLHEGVQHYRYPTPELQKQCRFMVEEGADAVICQHSHCPGSYEIFRGKPIVYGQGDLISDSKSKLKDDTGFLVKLTLRQHINMLIIPYRQLADGGLRHLTKQEEECFLTDLEQRNLLVTDSDALEREWRNHCRLLRDTYYARLNSYNRVYRVLNRKLHFIENISAKNAANLLNLFRCSAHRQVLEMIFLDILSQKLNRGR